MKFYRKNIELVYKTQYIAIRKNVLQYVLETKILQYIGKPIILHSPRYMLTRHNLVVARNTTWEEVSCKENEYSVSEKTLYRFLYGFN